MGNGNGNGNDPNERAPYSMPKAIENGADRELVDFLEKCLERNFNVRWSARDLLTHSFVSGLESEENGRTRRKKQKPEDLEFMTRTLMRYYLECGRTGKVLPLDEEQRTAMDEEYCDEERIRNIAEHCAYSVEEVRDFVFLRVNEVKNRYLKR